MLRPYFIKGLLVAVCVGLSASAVSGSDTVDRRQAPMASPAAGEQLGVAQVSLAGGWSSLGAGLDGWPTALIVYNGMLVAGVFGPIGYYGRVFAWNGSSWTQLGSDLGGPIHSLAVYNGQLIARGRFEPPDYPVRIYRLSGNSWSPMSPEFDNTGDVYALGTYAGQLVVGGQFDFVGGLSARNIVSFNGSSWMSLGSVPGSGVDRHGVFALCEYNGQLIVGGQFSTAYPPGVTANSIAAWNGSSWSAITSGYLGGEYVSTLATYNGKLIACGDFTSVSGVAANRIASWNGSAWFPLGSGFDDGLNTSPPSCLAVYGDKLVAGGSFDAAGGTAAANIAAWNETAWSPLGMGLNASVRALTVYNGQLIAAGDFTSAGGVPVNHVAAWNDGTASQVCLQITSQLKICANTKTEGPTNVFTFSGNVALNDIVQFSGPVSVNMNTAHPELTGDGMVSAVGIQGQSYNLFSGPSHFTYYAKHDSLKIKQISDALLWVSNLQLFPAKIGTLVIDHGGQFVKARLLIGFPYPVDKALEYVLRANGINEYLLKASVDKVYHKLNGISGAGNIGPLHAKLGTFNVDALSINWDDLHNKFGGSFTVSIPGEIPVFPPSSGMRTDEVTSSFKSDIPVEIHDPAGVRYRTNLDTFLAMAGSGWFLGGFSVQIEFLNGTIDKLIVTLSTSYALGIPLGPTGLRITELGCGLEDLNAGNNNWKLKGLVDIKTALPDVPVFGAPIKIDDLTLTVSLAPYLQADGKLKIFGYDALQGKVVYDGATAQQFASAEGYLDFADLLIGRISIKVNGNGFEGAGSMTAKTPTDLPWYFNWLENKVIAAVKSGLRYDNITTTEDAFYFQFVYYGMNLGCKISLPDRNYQAGVNFEGLPVTLKNSSRAGTTIQFQVPTNCAQIAVVAGVPNQSLDFQLRNPSGTIIGSPQVSYYQFAPQFQTLAVVNGPTAGTWTFETTATNNVQMEARGENPRPWCNISLPSNAKSSSSTILLDCSDFNDTVEVGIYWDNNGEGFDGQLIAGFESVNNSTIDFNWNHAGLAPGEYHIYAKLDDKVNIPVLQYAPGSVWIPGTIELPANVQIHQTGDTVRAAWDIPQSQVVVGAVVYVRPTTGSTTDSYITLNSNSLVLSGLRPGNEYAIRVRLLDQNRNMGAPSEELIFEFSRPDSNNSPYFLPMQDKSWSFVTSQSKSYPLSTVDPDGDIVTISLLNSIDGANLIDSTLHWTPTISSIGYHELRFVASDGIEESDTLSVGVTVYSEEDVAKQIAFSANIFYEGDNAYVIVKDGVSLLPQVDITLRNLRTNEQNSVSCTRINTFDLLGKFSLSMVGASSLQVDHGDTISAVYFDGASSYQAECYFDSSWQTFDVVPPQQIVDLRVGALDRDSLKLYWTAPGDDSITGRALYYDLRYRYSPILADSEYLTSYAYVDIGYPGIPGSLDSVLIDLDSLRDLDSNRVVYFAIKAVDDRQNIGILSNLASVSQCGDCDENGRVDITDAVFLINYIFASGPAPNPMEIGDVDCNGRIDVTDAVYLIIYIFTGGLVPCAACI